MGVFCAAWRKRDADASALEKENEALKKQLEEMRGRLQEKEEKLEQKSTELQEKEEELEDQQEHVRALKCCISDKNEETKGMHSTRTVDRVTQTE